MSGRTAVRVVAAVAALLVAGGCSGIPTGGPVEQVRADEGLGQSTVRYAPAPPAPGASPQQVVSGYLDSMLAFPPSTGVTQEYLTQDAAQRWNPAAGTQVYGSPRLSMVGGGTGGQAGEVRVALSTRGVLGLDASGQVTDTETSRERIVTLQRVDGEWRISDPPPGLLVSEKFYVDYYRAFQVFYFDRSGSRLVPSVVHLPAGEQLATALVASLARGPSEPTAQQRTYLPSLGDVRPSVPVDAEGVAEVDVGDEVGELSEVDQGRLSAQLVWTLRQVDDVTGVRLTAGSASVTPSGQAVQSIDGWARYGPPAEVSGPFAVIGGAQARVAEVLGRRSARSVPRDWDVGVGQTARIVVGRSHVATLSPSGDGLLVRSKAGADALTVAVDDLVAARWLPDETLLVVDRPDGLRVRLVEEDATRLLPSPGLDDLAVTSLSVSPDGARYAVTTSGDDAAVLVGALRWSSDGSTVEELAATRSMGWDIGRPNSVEWIDGARLALLGDTELGRQVFSGFADGTGLGGGVAGGAPILPDVQPRDLVVEGDLRWTVDRRDRLWFLDPREGWTRLGIDDVRSLSPGA